MPRTADYAFLLESVEGGEHVGRYSFLGKDPFLILRASRRNDSSNAPACHRERGRHSSRRYARLMADFRAPFVPDLPRFTGGAVGYLGYGAASWFEPVLGDLGQRLDGADDAGFMVFDTVLAFDHVQHRILIIVERAHHGRRRPRIALSVRNDQNPMLHVIEGQHGIEHHEAIVSPVGAPRSCPRTTDSQRPRR